ncbi:MAG: flippase [Bacteroidota bacterium]
MDINLRKYLPKAITDRFSEKENILVVLANTFWLVSDRIIRLVVALFVGAWVARYLAPENYGKLNYALAFVTLFGSFTTLGFDSILIRDIVTNPDKKNKLMGSAFYIRLIAGLIVYVVSLLLVVFIKDDTRDAETVLIIGIIGLGNIFLGFDIIDLYFQSQVKSKYTIFAKNSAFIIISAIKVIMIVGGVSLVVLSITWLLEMIFNALALVIVYQKRNFSIWKWQKEWNTMKYLLSQGLGFYIAYISTFIYMKMDQIMIGDMIDNTAAGLYASSTKLYEIPYTLLLIIGSSVFPSLINVYNVDKELFYQRIRQITTFLSMFGLVVIAATWIFGAWGINILFGSEYSGAVEILNIQIVGVYFMCLGVLRSSYLSIVSGQKVLMVSTIFATIFNLVANFYLIPLMGAKGSALATVITQFLSLFFINFFFDKTRRYFFMQTESILLLEFFARFKKQIHPTK